MLILMSLLPLLLSICIMVFLKRDSKYIKPFALVGSVAPLVFTKILLNQIGIVQDINWFSIGGIAFNITASLLPINMLFFLLIAIISPLVVFYSTGFMDVLSEDKRFYIELLSLQAAMLAFSLSGNFVLLFIAWEFLSVTSYLLVGFWNHNEGATRAARETLTMILVGDIALLASIAIIFATYSTLQFTALVSAVATSGVSPGLSAALLLLVLAVLTKSAQFPFQEWLPASTEGPAPVSAFLHSSAMAKAGVFLVILLFPLFANTRVLTIVAVVGALTVLIGISNALTSGNIKKILAYSTMEELGLMLFALGIGAYAAALYFFFVQTFYKALLFFYAGALMKANNTEEIDEMKGGSNRIVFLTGLFGVLALAGFVPFNGFFAGVLLQSYAKNLYSYLFLLFVDLLVSLFIARWFFVPAQKPVNALARNRLNLRYRMIAKGMILPLVILAALCLVTSYFLNYVMATAGAMSVYGYGVNTNFGLSDFDMVAETLLVFAGVAVMYFVYHKRRELTNRFDLIRKLFSNNSLFNEVYSYVANFANYVAGVAEFIDLSVSDIFDSFGRSTSALGSVAASLQTGLVNNYALIAAIGFAVLLILLVIR